jgi:hypothetical protein
LWNESFFSAPQLKRDSLGADVDWRMSSMIRPLGVIATASPLVFLPVGCGLPTAPDPGTHYVLITIDGRRVPTWVSQPGAQDSAYAVVLAEEFAVVSASTLTWSKFLGVAHRHADGTFTYTATTCWRMPANYRQHADTLVLFNAPALPGAESPPVLFVDGSDLVQRTVTNVEYRYVPARPLTIRLLASARRRRLTCA